MNNGGDTDDNKQGRTTLMLIIGLFTLPLLVVLAMHQFSLRPGGASHGEFVNPPQPLHIVPMLSWQNKQFSEAGLHDKWSLVYIAPVPCDEPCAAQIHMMRQVHAALGKDIARVQRIMLVAENFDATRLDNIQSDYPDLIILAKPSQAVAQMAGQLGVPRVIARSTYLIDPLGNAMMRYIPTADPSGMRKDLTRLLAYSWVG